MKNVDPTHKSIDELTQDLLSELLLEGLINKPATNVSEINLGFHGGVAKDFLTYIKSSFDLALGAYNSSQLNYIWKNSSRYDLKKTTKYPAASINVWFSNIHEFYQKGETWLFLAIFSSMAPNPTLGKYEKIHEEKIVNSIASLDKSISENPSTGEEVGAYAHEMYDIANAICKDNAKKYQTETLQQIVGGLLEEELGEIIDRHKTNTLSNRLARKLWNYWNLSEPRSYLYYLFKFYSQEKKRWNFWGVKRTGDIGKRTHFVRSLTHAFMIRIGTPSRSEVEEITNFLFDGNISQKQIIDITRDIVANPLIFESPSGLKCSLFSLAEDVFSRSRRTTR